jgi:hypothetical protein
VASTKNGSGNAWRRPPAVNLMFLHRFEQRGLRFRRRAIDFVGEEQIAKHRSWKESQFARSRCFIFLNHFSPR